MVKNNSILDIKEILSEYSEDIQDAITQEAQNVAKKAQNELKNTSPKRTGKYRKGWRVSVEKGRGYVESTIYNATNWQLTHLLEKPHAIRNKYGRWGTSRPQVHIKPVEQKCISEVERNITTIIKNGG